MYSARITRHTPTAFLFMIDQSGSMQEKMQFGSRLTTKAEVVARVTNMLLRELTSRCRRESGIIDYFEIGAIGYCGSEAVSLLGNKNFISSSQLAQTNCSKRKITSERRHPDGSTMLITEELKYWVEPRAEGNTPMRSALEQALTLIERWCRKSSNKDSYPPTVFNITDGEATDADHEELVYLANEMKSLGTSDGNPLLININISSSFSRHTVLFPTCREELPGCRYSNMLYDMSSTMPQEYEESILSIRPGLTPPFRAMSMNTSAADLISMMNIGSLSMNRTL